jgi:hypothetical protein
MANFVRASARLADTPGSRNDVVETHGSIDMKPLDQSWINAPSWALLFYRTSSGVAKAMRDISFTDPDAIPLGRAGISAAKASLWGKYIKISAGAERIVTPSKYLTGLA